MPVLAVAQNDSAQCPTVDPITTTLENQSSYQDRRRSLTVQCGRELRKTARPIRAVNSSNLETTPIVTPQNEPSISDEHDLHNPEGTDVDAMGTSSSYLIGAEGPELSRTNYFGPSSTVSFLSLVRHVIGKSGSSLTSAEQNQNNAIDYSTESLREVSSEPLQRPAAWHDSTAFHVPPRGEADSLVANYWTWVYTLYPFLHRPTFTQRYEKLWEQRYRAQRTRNDVLFHCMMNAVFALGSHFQSEIDPADRITQSESFFLRCQQLLTLDLLDHGNIQLVQTLLLMGQYLQSTDKPNLCWNLVGLAIRIAQAIGLHLDLNNEPSSALDHRFEEVQVETKRRAWGGCILLDR